MNRRWSSRRSWTVSAAACALAGAAACATSHVTSVSDEGAALVCARPGLCARIVEEDSKALRSTLVVEVTAPLRAALHNAWLAAAGSTPCRGGRALNAVAKDEHLRLRGPMALEGTARFSLAFGGSSRAGELLDLDVRFPEGPVCLRLPLGAAPAADGGTPPAVLVSDGGPPTDGARE